MSTSNVGVLSDEPSGVPLNSTDMFTETSSASSFPLYSASSIAFIKMSKAPIQIEN